MQVWRTALALGVGVGLFGMSFGVLAVAAGASPLVACAASLLVFAGGSQFALVGVIAAGGSPLAGVVAGLLLNARYTAFGLALAPLLRGRLLTRVVGAQLVIDESAAVALAQPDPATARRAFWATGAILFVAWNLFTALGALAGSIVGDPEALGLDAAFPAGFLALLVPLLRDSASRVAAVGGAGIAVALLPVTPPGVPVVVAALGVLGGLVARRGREPSAPAPVEGVFEVSARRHAARVSALPWRASGGRR